MPAKCDRSGATFSATPCQLTQRLTRTPIAPILASVPLAGSATQMPTRPCPPLAAHAEPAERPDQPLLQPVHEAAHVARRHACRAGASGRASRRRRAGRGRDRSTARRARRRRWETGPGRSVRPAAPRCRRCRAADAPPARPARPPSRRGSPPRAPASRRARPDRASGPRRCATPRDARAVSRSAQRSGSAVIEAPSFIRYTAPPAGARSAARPMICGRGGMVDAQA